MWFWYAIIHTSKRNKETKMTFPTVIQMERQQHTMKCMNYSSIQTLNRLLAEIEREGYQTALQVKNSINGYLDLLSKGSIEQDYDQT